MTPKPKPDLFLLNLHPTFKVGDRSVFMVSKFDQTPSKFLFSNPIPGRVTWQDAKTLVVELKDGRVITITNYEDAKTIGILVEDQTDIIGACLIFDETGTVLDPNDERLRALSERKRQVWRNPMHPGVGNNGD